MGTLFCICLICQSHQRVDGKVETKNSDFSFGAQNQEGLIWKSELDVIHDLSKSAAFLPPVMPKKEAEEKEIRILKISQPSNHLHPISNPLTYPRCLTVIIFIHSRSSLSRRGALGK